MIGGRGEEGGVRGGWSEGHPCTSLQCSPSPTEEDSNPGLNPACLPQTYTGVPPVLSLKCTLNHTLACAAPRPTHPKKAEATCTALHYRTALQAEGGV